MVLFRLSSAGGADPLKHGILKVNQDSVFCIQVMLQFLSGTLNLSAMKMKELPADFALYMKFRFIVPRREFKHNRAAFLGQEFLQLPFV
ncbi:unknown [Sutterella sp. CAG:351]|nr:unknown [Sutterella sp. CAG:351]